MTTRPTSTALIFNNRATTYGELRDQVDHLPRRARLRSASVTATGWPWSAATACTSSSSYLAVLGLGAVIVPLNPTSPAPELEEQISTVGARWS